MRRYEAQIQPFDYSFMTVSWQSSKVRRAIGALEQRADRMADFKPSRPRCARSSIAGAH